MWRGQAHGGGSPDAILNRIVTPTGSSVAVKTAVVADRRTIWPEMLSRLWPPPSASVTTVGIAGTGGSASQSEPANLA